MQDQTAQDLLLCKLSCKLALSVTWPCLLLPVPLRTGMSCCCRAHKLECSIQHC